MYSYFYFYICDVPTILRYNNMHIFVTEEKGFIFYENIKKKIYVLIMYKYLYVNEYIE